MDPPGPVHASVYVDVVDGVTDCVPLVGCAPDQAPPAVQDVAFVEDQLSVALIPALMLVGVTPRLAVGGGGALVTLSVVEAAADVPPGPMQTRV